MRVLYRNPSKQKGCYHHSSFCYPNQPEMKKYINDCGRRKRYFVSINGEYNIPQFWEVSKAEFDNAKETFKQAMEYFGIFL